MIDQTQLPPVDDLDTTMRNVARGVAQGIYPLEDILQHCQVEPRDFNKWKDHPQFLRYLQSESEAWNNANNAVERTKVKAGIVMEEFLVQANTELHDRKLPLNHRVELAKLLAKLAGMGEPKGFGIPGAGGVGGFTLQINIGAGAAPVSIRQSSKPVIEHEDDDLLSSPNSLEGYDE